MLQYVLNDMQFALALVSVHQHILFTGEIFPFKTNLKNQKSKNEVISRKFSIARSQRIKQ
jgi:hypothetical protein